MNRISSQSPQNVARRRLVKYVAAGAGLALLPWRRALADSATRDTANSREHEAAPARMRVRTIPTSGEALALVGLGSSGAFSTRSDATLADLRTVMKEFVAMGGQMIDTSPTYGNAEINIGRIAIQTGVRDKLFMATKVHIHGERAGIEQMEQSEKRLGKPIDLMQIHNFIDADTQWATLEKMKAEGQVRYIGMTHYLTSAFEELERHMKVKKLDFVQFNYSVMTPDAQQRLLPLAADRGIAVIVNRAFDDGRFFVRVKGKPLPGYAAEFDCHSWAQFALKYVLADAAVNAVIPATSNPEHLRDNMRAGYGALPDRAMQKRMRATIAQY